MHKYRRATVIIGVALAATMFGILGPAAYAAGHSTPPGPPGWVNADGTVSASTLPRQFPIVGPNGALLRDAKGNVRQWSTRKDLPTPPAAPGGGGDAARRLAPGGTGAAVEQIEVPTQRP